MSEIPLEILIFGAGGKGHSHAALCYQFTLADTVPLQIAVGATFGWRLSLCAHTRVTVVCRSNYDVVRNHGFQLRTSTWGNGIFRPDRVVKTVDQVQHILFDYVVLANKMSQAVQDTVVERIQGAVRQRTTLVTVQNGVGLERELHQAFPHNLILSAICYFSCTQIPPGTIQQLSQLHPKAFRFGTHSSPDSIVGTSAFRVLVASDPQFEFVPDIEVERWTKLVFNGSWNPVAAIFGLDTHQLLENPYGFAIVARLAEEIYQVALASGIRLPSDVPLRMLDAARINPALVPTMLQDVKRNNPMEIEPLCGNIWRQADRFGMPVPTLKATYRLLNSLETTSHLVRGSARSNFSAASGKQSKFDGKCNESSGPRDRHRRCIDS